MARMWHGPSVELKAAEADPLWAAIHRRNAKLGVFCNTTPDGKAASFYTISGNVQHDLGTVEGADPMLAALWGSHKFAGYDADLIQLHHSYLDRLAEDIVLDGYAIVRNLCQAVDQFI
jgi:hypothetical protein